MNVKLWEIRRTAKAVLFSTMPNGEGGREVWVPLSQINHISKDKLDRHGWIPSLVEVSDWFGEKEEL